MTGDSGDCRIRGRQSPGDIVSTFRARTAPNQGSISTEVDAAMPRATTEGGARRTRSVWSAAEHLRRASRGPSAVRRAVATATAELSEHEARVGDMLRVWIPGGQPADHLDARDGRETRRGLGVRHLFAEEPAINRGQARSAPLVTAVSVSLDSVGDRHRVSDSVGCVVVPHPCRPRGHRFRRMSLTPFAAVETDRCRTRTTRPPFRNR